MIKKINTKEMDDYIMQNTKNSFIYIDQIKNINEENLKLAIYKNLDYQISKKRYELTILKYLVDKFIKYKKGESFCEAIPCYEKLYKTSKQFLEDLDKKQALNSPINTYEVAFKAKKYIKLFIEELTLFNDTQYAAKEESGLVCVNYPKWKKYICEIVNIWDFYSNNGQEMKLGPRYLGVKKYLTVRQFLRQNINKIDSGGIKKNKISDLYKPHFVLLRDDLVRIIIDLLTVFFLFFSIIYSPLKVFLGYYNNSNNVLAKLTDIFFFIEIFFNIRTAYNDKSNNIIYDTNLIFVNYLFGLCFFDLIITIPFEVFLINKKKIFIICQTSRITLNFIRIVKLFPIMSKIEQTKAMSYFRLLKLCIVFFIFAHWMGCILYFISETSLLWNILNKTCYINYSDSSKQGIKYKCQYLYSLYQGIYILANQYTSEMTVASNLASSKEYLVFIIEYQIGQILAAYIFGAMTSLINNINQAENFFTDKIDMLNEHMSFYEISMETQNDIRVYYSYLWQRHRDMIYGKQHFNLLSLSLREKFEVMNLKESEIYLARFYNLNLGNPKLVLKILMNLTKVIIFPYEILFEEGIVSKGVYILYNGEVNLSSSISQSFPEFKLKISDEIISEMKKNKLKNNEDFPTNKLKLLDESLSFVFPLLPAFIKTGRNWQTCSSTDFSDLLFLPMKDFDEILKIFPVEMHTLKQRLLNFVVEFKLFEFDEIFSKLTLHSSRSSIKSNFEKKYNKYNIWIPIPIPISQKKIAKNYVSCFMKKIKNHTREIIFSGDIDIGFNANVICQILNNKEKKENVVVNIDEKKMKISDPIDQMKNISTLISYMALNLKNNINT